MRPLASRSFPSSGGSAHRRLFARGDDSDRPAGAEVDRHQRIGICGQPQLRARARKLDEDRATVEGRHASDPELGIEAVGQIVAGLPGICRIVYQDDQCRRIICGRSQARAKVSRNRRGAPRRLVHQPSTTVKEFAASRR